MREDPSGSRSGRLLVTLNVLNPNEDPGWPRTMSALAFMVPGLMQRRLRRPGVDGLTLLRQLTVSYTASTVLLGVVLLFMSSRGGDALPWLLGLVVLAVFATLIGRVVERPLDCSSDAALAGVYRTRFFLRVVFAETVALFAFVFALSGGPKWIYFVGAAFTLLRFWTGIAPTRSALVREQEALNARGCGLSLIAALRSSGSSSADV